MQLYLAFRYLASHMELCITSTYDYSSVLPISITRRYGDRHGGKERHHTGKSDAYECMRLSGVGSEMGWDIKDIKGTTWVDRDNDTDVSAMQKCDVVKKCYV